MNHPEAFCLMTYKCRHCDEEEILWNSRDGVTPFIIGCQNCGKEMQHIKWDRDFPIKDLFPIGIRWFIDLTKEKYTGIIRKRIETDPGFLPKDINKEEVIKSIVEEDMQEGSPDIMSLNEVKQFIMTKFYEKEKES